MQAWNVVVNGMDGARCTVLVGLTSKSNGRRRTDDGERDCGRQSGEEEPPPGISAASFQIEEEEKTKKRRRRIEKNMTALTFWWWWWCCMHCQARHGMRLSLSLSLSSFFCHESSKREYIQHAHSRTEEER